MDKDFLNELKLVDITSIFKKQILLWQKTTGLYVSFLPFQKVFREKVISIHRKTLSPFPCGIGFSIQAILSGNVKNWTTDKKGYSGTVLLELSKPFDILNCELLLAKLNAYDFHKNSLKTMRNNLSI